jgi:hypothetical protein
MRNPPIPGERRIENISAGEQSPRTDRKGRAARGPIIKEIIFNEIILRRKGNLQKPIVRTSTDN